MSFLYSPRFHWNFEWHEEDFPGKVFLSASQVANIRKEICGFQQYHGETLFKY